jgi:hypothetical protein
MPFRGLTTEQWLHILFVIERTVHANLGIQPQEARILTTCWWEAMANRIDSLNMGRIA